MKKIMMALAMCLMSAGTGAIAQSTSGDHDTLVQRLEALESTLRNAIIPTDQPCDKLGIGWIPYGPMAGRFPLAAGQGRDDREEKREFFLDDEGGSYQHRLTVSEMPKHTHHFSDRYNEGVRADYGDDEPTKHTNNKKSTENAGGGEPHTHMPPYRVLNFCWQR